MQNKAGGQKKRDRIHFASVEEILGAPVTKEDATEIRIDQIHAFENHPFKVIDDDRMFDLVESIKENGVLVPVLVRPDDEGTYEMISGHRRTHAAKLAGLTTIPAIIKGMTNDEATIAMVDSNIQREEILPSERAFALKMKMDALRHQGRRTDLLEKETLATKWPRFSENTRETMATEWPKTQGNDDGENTSATKWPKDQESLEETTATKWPKNLKESEEDTSATKWLKTHSEDHETSATKWPRITTADRVGEGFGMKRVQVRKYIRLTYLYEGLLHLVDEKKLAIALAVDISYFNQDIQKWLYEYIKENGAIKQQQVAVLKEHPNLDNMTQYIMIALLNDAYRKPKPTGSLQLSKKTLDQYFPADYSITEREQIVLKLLQQWHEKEEKDSNMKEALE